MKKKKFLYISLLIFALINLLVFSANKAYAVPNPPKYVFAKGSGWGSMAVNWSLVGSVTGYYVYKSTDGTNFTKIAIIADPMDGFYTDSGLNSSTQYYYRVSAYDGTGESTQSTDAAWSTGYTLPPNAPRGLTLTDNRNGTVTATWNKGTEPNVVGYNIYRGIQSDGSKTKLNTSLITGTTYLDTSVSFYIDLYYRVTAVDNTGAESATDSPEKWIKTKAMPPTVVPHVLFDLKTDLCAKCHNTHSALGANLIKLQRQQDICFSCHDGTGSENVTYQEFANYSSRHPVDAGSYTGGSLVCSNCHDPHLNYKDSSYPKILSVNYNGTKVNTGNGVCYGCHGKTSTLVGGDHETAFSGSIHNTNMPNPPSGTKVLCSNCHEPHGTPNARLKVYKEENSCFACHANSNTTALAPDIYDRVNASPDSDTHHDIFDVDQLKNGSKIECTNCHNPHGVTKTYPNVDPQSPSPGNLWKGTINDFCFRCHGGTFPSSTQTSPYAPGVTSGTETLTNIQQAYQTDFHGNGVGTKNVFDPDMGYSNNMVVDCTACHEPHGTPNNYNLRSTVYSKDGTKHKDGLMVYKFTYTDSYGTHTGYDLRFFCNACHGQAQMGNNKGFPSNCATSNCHDHGTVGKF